MTSKLIIPEERLNKLKMLPTLQPTTEMQFSPQFQNSPLITPKMIGERLTRQVPQGFLTEPIEIKATPELVEKAYKVAEIGGWAGGGLPGMMAEIRAFHGSPYKFDKFKMEKVGTGEGAQAFGHGLYFTSEKDIAKHYAKTKYNPKLSSFHLKRNGVEIFPFDLPPGTPYEVKYALQYLKGNKKDLALREIRKAKESGRATQELLDIEQDIINGNFKLEFDSNIYSVTLHKGKKPGEYDYLKWDENITSEVENKVNRLFEKEKHGHHPAYSGDQTGAELYHRLSQALGSDREASAFLLRAGIDGIEYPAGTLSGGAKKGAKNYVVFDENAITIEK